jgi:predicted DNA-binding transcriptional regulator YafY
VVIRRRGAGAFLKLVLRHIQMSTSRIVKIANLLRVRPRTERELAVQLRTSERTIKRDLQILDALEIGLTAERGDYRTLTYKLAKFRKYMLD